jgi:hypothetical protein
VSIVIRRTGASSIIATGADQFAARSLVTARTVALPMARRPIEASS